MTNRINRSNMRLMMKQLRTVADLLGYKVTINRRKVKFYHTLMICWPEAYCDFVHKRISITIYGRPARRSIIHTFAHEIRHAIHANNGLFKDYYRQEPFIWVKGPVHMRNSTASTIKAFNLKNAWLAERDCDRWGNKFLAHYGVKPMKTKYYYWATAAYRINKVLESCRQNGK